ncbi:hypothetical protein C4559_03195 [Candidatus Microgenomates bacterium]|nr:MAG: hypothetical protein C4559_03195 [Candidatus Microgenomates bacterium]
MRNKIKFYFLIGAVSFLPLFGIFLTSNLNHTHDGLVHLPRIAAYYKALGDLQIPVRWAGDLNYGYGMPLFNFMYQVPYFISSIFLFLGFNLVTSFKIVLSLSYIFSGLFMFAFAKAFFKDTKKAFLVTIFYQFAPFRLIEVLARGSFGEVYVYAFFPLVLLGLTLLFKKFSVINFIIASVSTSLLILSHNSMSLVFFSVSVGFLVFFSKNKKNLILGSFSLLLGLLMASFYWMPAIFEHKFTYGDFYMKNVYESRFPSIAEFFSPNLAKDFDLQRGKVPVGLGIFQMISIFLSLILIFKKKTDIVIKKVLFFALAVLIVSMFFMQPISKLFWINFSYLRQFQFPWRFMAITCFSTSMLSISFFYFNIFRKKILYVSLIAFVVLSTIPYWKPPEGYDKVDEKYYWNYPLTSTYYGETDIVWSAGPAKAYPNNRIEVIGGKAVISNFIKKSNKQTFNIDAKTNAQLVANTQYFPGWRVYIDGKTVPVEFQDQHWRGMMTFLVPKGEHDVKLIFEESKIRFFSDIVSLIGVLSLAIFGFSKAKKII